jgi:ABC-type branched-subunit amino acid transport system ATPase component
VVQAGLIQVPEGRRVFPNLSVLENLELGAFTRARERRAANLERVFAIFPRLKERIAQAGRHHERRRAADAGHRPRPDGRAALLILDEPSLGLSPLLVEELFTLIGRLHADGLAVLLVEQNVGQSLEIAQRAYVLENGSLRFEGTPAELLASDELRRPTWDCRRNPMPRRHALHALATLPSQVALAQGGSPPHPGCGSRHAGWQHRHHGARAGAWRWAACWAAR